MFFTLFGIRSRGGGGPKVLVHNVLMQFFNPDSAKIELFETGFFDIVTTENDHPRYVKHILGCICVLFIAFRYRAPGGGGGGGSQGIGTQPADAAFPPGQLKYRSF